MNFNKETPKKINKFFYQTKQWGNDQELSTRISKTHKIKHDGLKTKINKLENMETINMRLTKSIN